MATFELTTPIYQRDYQNHRFENESYETTKQQNLFSGSTISSTPPTPSSSSKSSDFLLGNQSSNPREGVNQSLNEPLFISYSSGDFTTNCYYENNDSLVSLLPATQKQSIMKGLVGQNLNGNKAQASTQSTLAIHPSSASPLTTLNEEDEL